MSNDSKIAEAIDRNFTSPCVTVNFCEPANVVDVIDRVASGSHAIAKSMKSLENLEGVAQALQMIREDKSLAETLYHCFISEQGRGGNVSDAIKHLSSSVSTGLSGVEDGLMAIAKAISGTRDV